uniref:Putative plastocyanin-like domain protein n=1 Tax=Davidia involucrata TaxID=16924 RepID=A0A5B7BTA1_DAVIN
MEQGSNSLSFLFFILSCLLLLLSFAGTVEAYKNYTVGDSLGWYDNLRKPNANYRKWVAGKNFSLGDFLIFNTDNNHSVVQTYNFNTYKHCDYNNAQENDTIEWSAAEPSSTTPHAVSVAIPLLKVGKTYFLSGDYDGEQCQHGQHFKINVTYGQGLPESLKNLSDESPAPASPNSGNDESAPDTVIPSNFNNTQESSDVREESGSVSLSVFLKIFNRQLNGILILLGLICSF